MLDVFESDGIENSIDYFDIHNLSFDHPLSSSEIDEFKTILFSINNLRQIYFKGNIDVDSIDKIKNLLSIGGFVDDRLIEKCIVREYNSKDTKRLLDSSYENPNTWQLSYDYDDESYILGEIPKCRELYSFVERIKMLAEKENLSQLEIIFRVYDIIKMFDLLEYEVENENLPDIAINSKATSRGLNKLFSYVLKKLNINSFVGREKNEDSNETFITLVDIKDDKYQIDGMYLFDPAMDSLPKNVYKSDDVRMINYNYFGLTLDDISYSKYNDVLIGAFGILSLDDLSFSYEKKESSKDVKTNKEMTGILSSFSYDYHDLFNRVKNSKTISIDTISALVNNVYGENDRIPNYLDLLKENYEARKEELFNPKPEEMLDKLLKQ